MEITKYCAFFHDGTLINVLHVDDKIEFSLCSAEIDPETMNDIPISFDAFYCIKGKLHLDKIKAIVVNGTPFYGNLKLLSDDGEIMNLEINENKMQLQVLWTDSGDFTTYDITAEKIYWENLPDLLVYPMQRVHYPSRNRKNIINRHNHYLNSEMTGKHNKYLDQNNNPVPQGSNLSRVVSSSKKEVKKDLNLRLTSTNFIFSEYCVYFHDGSLITIEEKNNNLSFSLQSCEIDNEELGQILPLSSEKRLSGKLHLDSFKSVIINGQMSKEPLKMKGDSGEIIQLECDENQMTIDVLWETYHPKYLQGFAERIVIVAEKIWWESIPELIDNFW